MADYLYYSSTSGDDPSTSYNMEDLLSCTVCCEPYHEKTRHPVLLPRCGHSFCRPCIAFLVKKGCVICPSCRMDQRVEGADNLPTEFSLLAISCAQQVTKQETCLNHNVKLSFWCKTCNVPACGECLFEDHPMTSHLVIKSTVYVTEMKDSVTAITNKFMEALDGREKCFFEKIFNCTKLINDALRTITVLRKDMEEARDLMKGVKTVEGIAPTQHLSEAAKFLGLKWNLQDVNLNLNAVMVHKEDTNAEEEKEKEEVETKEPETTGEEEEREEGKHDEESLGGSTTNGDESSENGTNEKEKADDEQEKDVDEEENLTEDEKRKRLKLQRLKAKLAAATAEAEQAKLEALRKPSKEKLDGRRERKTENGEKEKKASVENKENKEGKSSEENKEKSLTDTGREAYDPISKMNLKTWQQITKYKPVPREPSITPERDIKKKTKTKKDDLVTEKNSDDMERDNKKEEEDQEADKNKMKEGKSKEDIRIETTLESNKENKEAESTNTSEAKENATNEPTETNSSTEANKTATDAADAKPESKSENKKASTSGIKRPRGRLARNALKRAQTMDFSKKQPEIEESDTNKESESDNIRGLDLETSKTNKNNEETGMDNKEAEAQASGENKEEKEEPKVEEKKSKKKEAKKKEAKSDDMFEMEPEEKERIATELMQVPSLTVVIEGIGGLLARVSYESMGLHIYCHQFQELPYDVIVKSNVLHALIPTKRPMVFLDIGTDDQTLGRVYITLWGHLRRANNFLLLCLGDRGRSLKQSRLFAVLNADGPGERLQGGDYEYNNGRGGESLIDDLEYQLQYSMPMEMGLITSATCGSRSLDSQFFICTEEDLNRQFACPFGRVTVGLPVLKEAVWLVVTQEIWIQDCGVVLDCPRI